MKHRTTISFLCSLIFVFASKLAVAEITLITADRMLDVESGDISSPAGILVEDGVITAINPAQAPAAAQQVALGDVTLLPGLMDVHTHLTWDFTEPGWQTMYVKESPVDWAIIGVEAARKTLMAGFTTVRDLGSNGFPDVAVMRAVEKGLIIGPRILPAGNSLSITGGHCDITGFAPGVREIDYRWGVADGVDEVVKSVRYQIKHGARVIKICATAGVFSFEGPVGAQQYSEEELRAAAEEAHRHGLKIAAHAHGTEGIRAAVRAGVDSIEHATFLDDETLALIRDEGTFIVPNLYLTEAIDADKLPPAIREKELLTRPAMEEGFRKAVAAGVKIAYGTDAAIFPHGENARQFYANVRRGQPPLQAIQGATSIAAELLGLDNVGLLKEDMQADIIAVSGNPLDDVRVLENVLFVMKGGQIYKMP